MYKSDLTRLKACMRRAEAGEDVTLGFFGGSITQDSLATKHEYCYAYRVFQWWEKTFPKAKLHYVNGGIGGTTSHYGVSRVVTDMLMYQPDFVVVDFSVNDEPEKFFQETYEGLVRRMLTWSSVPAVLLLNNVFYDTGKNAQEYHNQIGEWYRLPYVSIKDTVWKRIKAGEFIREEISPDGLHPNDKGHALVASEITAYLENVRKSMWEDEEQTSLPSAMTDNAYERAQRLTIRKSVQGWMDFGQILTRKKGIWIISRTAGSAAKREIVCYLRQRHLVLQFSIERQSDTRRERQS